ncbi:MAG: tetratricopeptide repeat protein [Candidatus Bathyarchaeota archaeon]|nr:tetratricopeptide repeat protein [Candidatus Bathyarchaeota archaeon]
MQIIQTLVPSQIKGGFLDILTQAKPHFPKIQDSLKIPILFDNIESPEYVNLTGWKWDTPMLTGLKEWFVRHQAQAGDKVLIEIRTSNLEINNEYRLRFLKSNEAIPAEVESEDVGCFNNVAWYTTWLQKGIELSEKGRFEEALKALDMANRTCSYLEEHWILSGKIMRNLGRLEEAIKCFDIALSLNPKSGEAQNIKAVVLTQQSQANLTYAPIPTKNEERTHFLILKGRNTIEIWNEKRLPFEPKDWLLTFRNEIRSALTSLNCDTTEVLHAIYISPEREPSDIDNILFYNVGTQYFQQTKYAGLCFERSFSKTPPLPNASNLRSVEHYERYESQLKNSGFDFWIPTRTLIKWDSKLATDFMVRLKKTKNPALIWFAIKSGSINPVAEFQGVPSQFGLRLKITVPIWITCSFMDLVKPLIDGSVSAFHQHNGANEEAVAEHLTSTLEVRAQDIINYLRDSTYAVLGQRNLFWLRQNGIQWNPSDQDCIAVELLFGSSNEAMVEFQGELFEVIPKMIHLQADEDLPRYFHHELILNNTEATNCTRPPGVSHLDWSGCKTCFNWICGHSTCMHPAKEEKVIEGGALCPYEHCIENMPVMIDPQNGCRLFGHLCPAGERTQKECLKVAQAWQQKRLQERYDKSSGFERLSLDEFQKRHSNKGKFTKQDMKFCHAVFACFGHEHMWVVITQINDDGVEGWVNNEPRNAGSPKYGEHVFIRYGKIEDIS